MKKYFLVTSLAISAPLFLASCEDDDEVVVSTTDLPTEITNYVSTHFPDNDILQVTKEKEGDRDAYELTLEGNIDLDFNGNNEITDIDGISELPDSVIPTEISQYVDENYPDNAITDWELEDGHQQVELDNRVELEFDPNGGFLRIDS